MLCHISNMRRLISVLQYATNFGTTRREPLKRIKSGKPVILHILRRTTLFLRRVYRAAKFVTSLAAESIPKEAEITAKEWEEHYRLVRQRTVRSETTKDKAGALPPAVYEKAKTGT